MAEMVFAFDLLGKWQNGLDMKGDVGAVIADGKLNLVIFMAPAMHYYDAVASEVDNILQSVDLPDEEAPAS